MRWLLESLVPLVGKYRRKGLLVDTNVLLLLLVGSVDPSLVESFKITANQGFAEADFELLRAFIRTFQKVVTTPHILTEVSNQAGKLKGESHQKVFLGLVSLIERLEEHSETTQSLAKSEAFLKFGLTDTAISQLAEKGYLVLTVDYPLVGHLEKRGVDAVNFNHLRQLGWEGAWV